MTDVWTVRELDAADAPACDAVIASLPYFFGQPAGIADCAAAVRDERGLVALDPAGVIVGFLTHRSYYAGSAEITWMAVRHAERRRGVGRLLVEALSAMAGNEGIKQLFVITLGPSVAEPGVDDGYGGTRSFYEAVGFVALKELDAWGPGSPGIVFSRAIARGRQPIGPSPAPSRRFLGRLARAALDNAASLLEDARTLVEAARYPRGYAMAILAVEEFGKHLSCVGAATVSEDAADYWQRFRANFTSHRAKYGVGLAVLTGAVPIETSTSLRARLPGLIHADQAMKMRGFYVDMEGETVLEPPDLDEGAAQEAVRVAGEMIGPWARHWEGVDLEELFDRGVVHRHAGVSEAMAIADAEELARLLNRARLGSPP